MCGIAGYFSLSNINTSGHSPELRRMVRALKHRGPDSEGFFEKPGIAMGMRRLRVIDLATGDQPIANGDGTCWIVYNGEIYNFPALRKDLEKRGHRLRTQTDTEVILRLYEEKGTDCVHELNGMYTFAVYDSRKKSLFVARDPLGIKPLYYWQDKERLVFGSEIKAVLAAPGVTSVLNMESVSHFLSMNYLPAPHTLFQGIRQLEGGHWLLARDGHVAMQRFWNPELRCNDSITEEDALVKTRTLLQESVASQLIADVPVGSFLSGGLDSSSMVALIKEARQGPLETFSVGFKDHSYDESPNARRVAKFYGTTHHEIHVESSDIPPLMGELASQWDQPLADPAAFALYKLSALARKHVTVALSGDGGDELFVGYPTFHANRYLQWYQRFPKVIRKQLIEPLVDRLPSSTEKFSFDYKAKKFLEGAEFSKEKAHYWWRTIHSDQEKTQLFAAPFRDRLCDVQTASLYGRHFEDARSTDFVSQCLYADLRVWLGGNNLQKVDSMSMAHSLEARVPYLDQKLVEFLMVVPPKVKFRKNETKYLLKKTMKGLLPEEVLHRKKAGWHMPLAKWFCNDLKGFVTQRFEGDSGLFYKIFDKQAVQAVVGGHLRRKGNHSFKIWGLLVLQEWLKTYKPQIPSDSLQKIG